MVKWPFLLTSDWPKNVTLISKLKCQLLAEYDVNMSETIIKRVHNLRCTVKMQIFDFFTIHCTFCLYSLLHTWGYREVDSRSWVSKTKCNRDHLSLKLYTIIISVSEWGRHVICNYMPHVICNYMSHVICNYMSHVICNYMPHVICNYMPHVICNYMPHFDG